MEKEKIRYGKVIGKSILIAILASSIILFILFFIDIFVSTIFPRPSHGGSLLAEEAQAHNGKFQAYFGENVSAKDVKALLQAISTNNVTADTADELSTIYVVFNTSSSGGADTATKDINTVTAQIINGYTYKVYVCNSKASDTDSAEAVGYYKNGFLKCIRITQNPKQDIYSNNIGSYTFN